MSGQGHSGGAGEMPEPGGTVMDGVAEVFVQRRYGTWTPQDQADLEQRLASDPAYAQAWRQLMASWDALDAHAEAPEVMTHRAEAIAALRQGNARRWHGAAHTRMRPWRMATAAAVLLAVTALVWQWLPPGERPGEYRTGVGERRVVELEDRSRITLDAATVLRVYYSQGAREVRIEEGQAQFSVAKDPVRPFKVEAGDHTIVALGTVFTVEYVEREMRVAMMEGRVAVVPRTGALGLQGELGVRSSAASTASAGVVELSAGEDMRVMRDGRALLNTDADLDAATAWLQGQIIFRDESLGEAVRRFNRYSRTRIEVKDDGLAARRISGVFETGDTMGFVNAVERYLSVRVETADSGRLMISSR